jgi:dCMP deaminase
VRPTADTYFMNIAREVATRATCPRKHVGAVIVQGSQIISTGYNGSIRGQSHCEDAGVGCLMEGGHCTRTIHAEANAIIQAARHGVRVDGATLYVTASPCWPCFGLIVNAGIRRVVFGEAYRAGDPGPKRVAEVAASAGVALVALTPVTEVRGMRVDTVGALRVACVGSSPVVMATREVAAVRALPSFGKMTDDGKPDPLTCPKCHSEAKTSSGVWYCTEQHGPCSLG